MHAISCKAIAAPVTRRQPPFLRRRFAPQRASALSWTLAALAILIVLTTDAGHAANKITTQDDAGNQITLKGVANRVISLAPHLTELMFAAGAGDTLVGVVEYSDFPEAANAIPRIGDATYIDFERIVELQPDLIIGWQTGNPVRVIDKLKSLSLKVYVSEPSDFENVATTIENIGLMTGNEGTAAPVASKFRKEVQALAEKYQGAKTVSVFHPIWSDPLMTLNGKHIVSKLLQLCGGRNIFSELETISAEISVEAVLKANPDVIVGSDGEVTASTRAQFVKQWQSWPTLDAVKNENLFLVQSDLIHRPTPRLLEGAKQLCEVLDKVRN